MRIYNFPINIYFIVLSYLQQNRPNILQMFFSKNKTQHKNYNTIKLNKKLLLHYFFVISAWKSASQYEAKMFTLYKAVAAKWTIIWWSFWSWLTPAKSLQRPGWPRWYPVSHTPVRTRRTRYLSPDDSANPFWFYVLIVDSCVSLFSPSLILFYSTKVIRTPDAATVHNTSPRGSVHVTVNYQCSDFNRPISNLSVQFHHVCLQRYLISLPWYT